MIASLDNPDFVVLPELALCSYMASNEIFKYADENSKDTSEWSIEIVRKYNIYIGVGYLDFDGEDFYNSYMITSPEGVCGYISISEGETAVFKNGDFGSIIKTPLGNIGVAICYDAKRKHFYNNIHDEKLSMILFPHGCPADPTKQKRRRKY
ncbi:MAG: carbon-nitrogen hydrolase family protein [Firmicutes bacterium]|nr:carbon-nitrogen hydrolase family protein [Bacillota bacterium]